MTRSSNMDQEFLPATRSGGMRHSLTVLSVHDLSSLDGLTLFLRSILGFRSYIIDDLSDLFYAFS